jgi:hypothetical protein
VPSKALEAASRRTKQIVAEHATIYTHASTIANELRMSPRVLGRITGSLWLGEGGDRCDIGLCVKNAKEGLCVPGEGPQGVTLGMLWVCVVEGVHWCTGSWEVGSKLEPLPSS